MQGPLADGGCLGRRVIEWRTPLAVNSIWCPWPRPMLELRHQDAMSRGGGGGDDRRLWDDTTRGGRGGEEGEKIIGPFGWGMKKTIDIFECEIFKIIFEIICRYRWLWYILIALIFYFFTLKYNRELIFLLTILLLDIRNTYVFIKLIAFLKLYIATNYILYIQ